MSASPLDLPFRKLAPLTATQKRVLKAAQALCDRLGYAPSVREIGIEVGIASPSTVHGHLCCLRDKGYIEYHGVRQLRVLHPNH